MSDSTAERQILLAPGPVAKAAAPFAGEPEQRWMLKQPREVRRSFAEEVHGRPDLERRQEIWMLRQPERVRESYVREVLLALDPPPRDQVWMLRQSDDVRASYVEEVLLAE